MDPAEAKALGIQVIYQDLSLFPNLSVAENVPSTAIWEVWRGRFAGAMREIAGELLGRLGVALPLDAQWAACPLPSARRSRSAAASPPTPGCCSWTSPRRRLPAPRSSRFWASSSLRAHGVAVVFVSHRLDEVVEIAERVTVLRDGGKVGTFARGEVDSRRIGELMTGLSIEHRITARDVTAAPPLLDVRGLTRAGEYADVAFTLHEGEVLGLTGLLGAGRTELALSLFGMTRPDAGEIRLEGQPIALATNQDAIRAGIAYLSEDRLNLGLNMRQSVGDNLVLASLDRLANGLGWIAPARRRALAADWVEKLHIKILASNPVQQLSAAIRRVVLGKWLATTPKILILDSPTVGVDIGNKRGIYELIRRLAEGGVGILLISDEVSEVFYNCDRVLHMRDGRIVGDMVPGTVAEHALETQVYA